MARGLAAVKDTTADEAAWEESLNALAEELWFWAVSREGLAARGVSVSRRKIALARQLARDVLIVSGLPGAIDSDRASSLLEAAHELLNGESGVRSVVGGNTKTPLTAIPGMPAVLRSPPALRAVDAGASLDEDEETLPRRINPLVLLPDHADEELDVADATMPGVPVEVFRKYLAAVRR